MDKVVAGILLHFHITSKRRAAQFRRHLVCQQHTITRTCAAVRCTRGGTKIQVRMPCLLHH